MTPKARSGLTQDIRDILDAARAIQQLPRTSPPAEPQEIEETAEIEVYGLVANGCGHRDSAKENADFISPLLLAA